MEKLNIPPFDYNIRKNNDKPEIFDPIRKKYIVLTPEEWVRQHMIHYLHSEYSIPFALMKIEGGLHYNRMQKRSDILVYDRSGKPALLVECKSYKMRNLTENVFRQAAMYNRELRASWLVITNGWGFYCWHCKDDTIHQADEIPAWDEINR